MDRPRAASPGDAAGRAGAEPARGDPRRRPASGRAPPLLPHPGGEPRRLPGRGDRCVRPAVGPGLPDHPRQGDPTGRCGRAAAGAGDEPDLPPLRRDSISPRARRRSPSSPPAAGRRHWSGRSESAPVSALGYGSPRGEPALREALADHLGRTRGVVADPERIVILNGAAQGIILLAHALSGAGARRVAVEDPSLESQPHRLRMSGLQVAGQPVDAEGLTLDGLAADAVLVTPAHQFPTGAVLSGPRRRDLLAWARQHDALIVEDDYDAEFRYDREPVPALCRASIPTGSPTWGRPPRPWRRRSGWAGCCSPPARRRGGGGQAPPRRLLTGAGAARPGPPADQRRVATGTSGRCAPSTGGAAMPCSGRWSGTSPV